MTTRPLRFIAAAIAGLSVLIHLSVASAADPSPPLPEVVRGSTGHAPRPAPQRNAPTNCVLSPEARLAATVASGLSGSFAGTRYVTGPMSMEGAAALTAAIPSYGCAR